MSVPDVYTFAEPIMEMLREFYGSYDADVLDEVLVEEGFAQRLKSRGYDVRPWGEPAPADGAAAPGGGSVAIMRHRRVGPGGRPGGDRPVSGAGDRPTRIIRPVSPAQGGDRPGYTTERPSAAQNFDRARSQNMERSTPTPGIDRPGPRPGMERPAAPLERSATPVSGDTRPGLTPVERPAASAPVERRAMPAPVEERPVSAAPAEERPAEPAPAEAPAPTPTRGRRTSSSATSAETPRTTRATGTRTRAKADTASAEEAPAPRTRRTRTPRSSDNSES